MDYVMAGLFILFLFFIFRGYHQSKLEEREGREQKGNDESTAGDLKE